MVRHRSDIQGLRAVAVLLVALGHAGVPGLTGGYVGVDVFFVLSGFLITGLLLSEALETGRVSLVRFYVRRARRILPAAVLTLAVTTIAAQHLLNFVRARDVVTDSIWASFFAANVHFAALGSDYFQQGQPPSPIQHFWSLSVEEQFYLVWPSLLVLALFGVARGHARRGRLLLVIAAAGVASLAWSIHVTAATPSSAYFSTPARAWELALGAGLAVAAPALARLPAYAHVLLGWAGLTAVACAAALFSGSTSFPGYAALLPAVGAALVIVAGEHRLSVGRPLSVAPLRYVGDRSYAFYLWHWPVLVIAALYAGHDLSLATKLVLLAGAFGLSIVSYALVESPLRSRRWPTPVGGLAWPASAAAVLAVAFVVSGSLDGTAKRLEAAAASVKPPVLIDTAAAASLEEPPDAPLPPVVAAVRAAEDGAPIPSPLTPPVGNLRNDIYRFPNGCTPRTGQTRSRVCRLGDQSSSKVLAGHRRLARADVDANAPGHGPTGQLGGDPIRQGELHPAHLARRTRRVPHVVPLGDETGGAAATGRDADRRQLGRHVGADSRDSRDLSYDDDDAPLLARRDRRRRPARPAQRPDRLRARPALDDEDLLRPADEGSTADERGDRSKRPAAEGRLPEDPRLVLRPNAERAQDALPARHQPDDHIRRSRARVEDVRARARAAVPRGLPRPALRLDGSRALFPA